LLKKLVHFSGISQDHCPVHRPRALISPTASRELHPRRPRPWRPAPWPTMAGFVLSERPSCSP